MSVTWQRRNALMRDSSSALKDANDALKELVSSLKDERAMLLEKNKALEAKLTVQRFKQAKNEEAIAGVPCAESKLPHVVLLNIFRSLILPWEFYNTSVAAGSRSQWLVSLNTRTTCVLVCKHWYAPASQALYSDVVLRRMGQISALARTLRSTAAIYAPDRSRFIRSIYVNECIVLPAAASIVKEDLTFLLHRCTNLRTFALRSCPKFPSGDLAVDPEHRDWFNPTWYRDIGEDTPGSALMERCATSLEELSLVDPLVGQHLRRIHRILSVATNLRKLVLGPFFEPCDLVIAVPPSLVALEDLQLLNPDDAFRRHVQEAWTLPALQRLTLVGCEHFPKGLLEAHGTNMKYLHLLYNGTTSSFSWSDLELLEDLCPTLEHLVLPYMPVYSLQSIIRSPTLRFLDLWGLTPKRRVVELMLELSRMCALPSLHRVRILPHHDEGILPASLPLLCHPEDVDEDGTRVRVFPGVYILQTSWSLLVHRMLDTEGDGIVFEEDPWADSASDTLYLCDEDVEIDGDEEGSEEGDSALDTASDVDSICALPENHDQQIGERHNHSVEDGDLRGGEGEDKGNDSQMATIREPGGGEMRTRMEWVGGRTDELPIFTREELLKRFSESQREDFLFDPE